MSSLFATYIGMASHLNPEITNFASMAKQLVQGIQYCDILFMF